MTDQYREELAKLANEALDKAEEVWDAIGVELLEAKREIIAKFAVPSQIPGYPFIDDGVPIVDEFICMVVDMRDSTKHLLQAISAKHAEVSQLQRVYYETAALLPSLAQVVQWHQGNVTEYLGDGVLALFRSSSNRSEAIYSAHRAARESLEAAAIVSSVLTERYRLPELVIGIGLAISKTVVTLIGLDAYKQPKAFGECVFRATKLACERGLIIVDEGLERAWPTSKGGTLKFRSVKLRDVNGFVLHND
jgi:class 3 adenylate cyclase